MKIKETIIKEMREELRHELVKMLASEIYSGEEFRNLKEEILSEFFEQEGDKIQKVVEAIQSNPKETRDTADLLNRITSGEFKDYFERLIKKPGKDMTKGYQIPVRKNLERKPYSTAFSKEKEKLISDTIGAIINKDNGRKDFNAGDILSEKEKELFNSLLLSQAKDGKLEKLREIHKTEAAQMQIDYWLDNHVKLDEYPEGTKENIINYIKKNKSKLFFEKVDISYKDKRYVITEGIDNKFAVYIMEFNSDKTKRKEIAITNIVIDGEKVPEGKFNIVDGLEIFNFVLETFAEKENVPKSQRVSNRKKKGSTLEEENKQINKILGTSGWRSIKKDAADGKKTGTIKYTSKNHSKNPKSNKNITIANTNRKIMWKYKTETFEINRNSTITVDNKLNEFGKDGWEAFSIEESPIYGLAARMCKYRAKFGTEYKVRLKRRVE